MRFHGAIWLLSLVVGVALPAPLRAAGEDRDARWWPVQARPAGLVRTGHPRPFPEPQLAYQMLVQSVAGLAAKAVNERRGGEMGGGGPRNPGAEAGDAAVVGPAAPARAGGGGGV